MAKPQITPMASLQGSGIRPAPSSFSGLQFLAAATSRCWQKRVNDVKLTTRIPTAALPHSRSFLT